MKNFWKNKKILVTGGTGFIGFYVASVLEQNGAIVTITTKSKKGKEFELRNPGISNRIKIVEANLLNASDCSRVTAKQDMVFNFAALDGGLEYKRKHQAEILSANVKITLNILEACVINSIEKLLLMSSIDVSNDKHDGYSESKRFAETAGKIYSEQHKMSVIVIRSGNIYGPNDYAEGEKGRAIPNFIKQAFLNKDIRVKGDGSQKRTFLYVEDFSSCVLKVMQSSSNYNLLSLVSSRSISIKSLAEKIIKITKSKSKITYEKDKISVTMSKQNNIKMANIHQETSLNDGLAKTVKFYK